jgi:hypothetical protein
MKTIGVSVSEGLGITEQRYRPREMVGRGGGRSVRGECCILRFGRKIRTNMHCIYAGHTLPVCVPVCMCFEIAYCTTMNMHGVIYG